MTRLLFILAAVLVLASPASAMEVGMQDDLTIVQGFRDRDLALRQFKRMGGTTVRMNLEHTRATHALSDVDADATTTPLRFYDGAVDAVLDHDLDVQLTLVFKDQPRPSVIARWMRNVARHFGEDVERYSISNEPDLLLPATCPREAQKRFRRRHRRLMSIGPDGRIRAQVLTGNHTMNLETACKRLKRGKLYHRIVQASANGIRDVAPRAEVLAGETSAQPGLEWFARGARPRELQVDGWAHHPFQLRDFTPYRPSEKWGIGNLPLLQQTIGIPLYFTEFAYPFPGSAFARKAFKRRISFPEIAGALTQAWTRARDGGARMMTQYQWYLKPAWRTEIWESALLARDDGVVTPPYRALQSLIASWED